MNTTIYLGPPGTGKTTKLLDVVDGLFAQGVSPESVGYVSFTRKAAYEARDRAVKKFGLDPLRFQYFRTLHSLAWKMLGMSQDNLFKSKDLKVLSELTGYGFSSNWTAVDEPQPAMSSKGDRALHLHHLSRNKKISIRNQFDIDPLGLTWDEVRFIIGNYEKLKQSLAKLDYTDVLVRYLESNNPPPIEWLIVDEAQDLTKLQWEMVDLLSKPVKKRWCAGDDDQAIFRWSGADVEQFINLKGEEVQLTQSYRVPKAPWALSQELAANIHNRRAKVWNPREEAGSLTWVNYLDELPLDQGNWLLLSRNRAFLQGFADHLQRLGVFYDGSGLVSTPADYSTIQAIHAWHRLLRGEKVQAREMVEVYGYMSSKFRVKMGAKVALARIPEDTLLDKQTMINDFGLLTDQPWYDAFDRMADGVKAFVRNALRRGEKLTKTPRIKISTIHRIKGGECDNVVLLTDMAAQSYYSLQNNPDDEWRTFYVGATRTKETLWIVNPQTRYHIPIRS